MSIAYLNGEYLPLENARVSAMDRGFLFGDGVYEVIPVYNGKLFRLDEHIDRLFNSLMNIKLSLAMDAKTIKQTIQTLVSKNPYPNQTVYLQVTRGFELDRKFTFPEVTNPTFFAFCSPLTTKSIAEMAQGIRTITLTDIRWHNCNTKAITLLANVLLRQQAKDSGVDEAILIRDGCPIEGTSSNLFIVKDGVIITPPLTPEILSGITRSLVLEIAEAHQIPTIIRSITLDELLNANEVWLTGTSREISPVLQINDITIGAGQAGPVWYKMIQLYQEFKQSIK